MILLASYIYKLYICVRNNTNTYKMTYTETLKIEKQIKNLDSKTTKLYKEYKNLETKQDLTNDDDMYILYSQKMEEVNSKIMTISTERELLSDSI